MGNDVIQVDFGLIFDFRLLTYDYMTSDLQTLRPCFEKGINELFL